MGVMLGLMLAMVFWALASSDSNYAIAAGLFAIVAQMGG